MTGATKPELHAAADAIRKAARVVVACHVNPDGDALGSAIALALTLSSHGWQVVASFGTSDGSGVPATLSFLPGQQLLCEPATVLRQPAPDLLITVDTGSPDRLGPLQPLTQTAAHTLVIDHHASNAGFGDLLLLDPTAAATTVLVTRLLDELGLALTTETATCLYVGLVTDTGQFQFSATTPAVHTLAARLLEAGVEPEPIGRALFGTADFAAVQLEGLALVRAVLEPELVWTWVTVEEREAAKVPLADIEGIIDALRATAQAEVTVVLKGVAAAAEPVLTAAEPGGDVVAEPVLVADEPGGAAPVWMASVRSKGSVDVGAACVSLGGGGHRFAAGATLTGELDEVMARLRAALRR